MHKVGRRETLAEKTYSRTDSIVPAAVLRPKAEKNGYPDTGRDYRRRKIYYINMGSL